MARYFLDASGLNQYTQALKNGTLVAGRAQDSSRADYASDASTAFYAAHAAAEGLIGIVPLANLPQGALERLVKVANQAAMLALTAEDVQLGDTVQTTDNGHMYMVVDESKLGTIDAFVEYTAGTATHALNADYATAAGDASRAETAAALDDAPSLAAGTTDTNKITVTAGGKTSDEFTVPYATSAGQVEWANVQNKPETYDASIVMMTGYTKASTVADVSTADSARTAIGKLEKKVDDVSAAFGSHTHESDQITAMTGYSIAQAYTDVSTGDTLNQAIGKIEKKAVDASNTADWDSITNKPTEYTPALHTQDASTITAMTGYQVAGSYTAVSASDSLETAIGKIEKKALDASNTADWGSITSKPETFTPSLHTQDASTITALTGYVKASELAAIEATDSLEVALGKLEYRAEQGADEPISNATIDSIIAGTFGA